MTTSGLTSGKEWVSKRVILGSKMKLKANLITEGF